MSEWEEGRIEVSVVNAANLPRLHVGSMHAIQVVDRETCTALVLPGASQDEAERLLRMIVDGNSGGEMTSQNPTTDDTVTSQNGHCEHCAEGCHGDEINLRRGVPYWHSANALMYMGLDWKQGDCPLCAEQRIGAARERARIVAWIRTSIGDEADTGELADDIERGAHLEASRG